MSNDVIIVELCSRCEPARQFQEISRQALPRRAITPWGDFPQTVEFRTPPDRIEMFLNP